MGERRAGERGVRVDVERGIVRRKEREGFLKNLKRKEILCMMPERRASSHGRALGPAFPGRSDSGRTSSGAPGVVSSHWK